MNRRPLIAAGTCLGIGLGGFVDGIVFHQLLQVHSMMSAKVDRTTVAGLEINMFWDGVFHGFTWLATVVGMAMLWHAVRRSDVPLSTPTFVGSQFLGWGMFNLVEGVINHHVLHIHHVTETAGHLWWDLAFLVSGVMLGLLGWGMIRAGESDASFRRAHRERVGAPLLSGE